jgi:hypothetical protein
MAAALKAGILYVCGIFALGFVLGTLRTLVIAPLLGPLIAVFLELPLILAASWWLCGVLVRRLSVPKDAGLRLLMGAIAFAVLMVAELALAVWGFGRTPAQHWAAFAALPVQIGLAGQIGFALLPLLRR